LPVAGNCGATIRDEERRLFFVGMTRARWRGRGPQGPIPDGHFVNAQGPSQNPIAFGGVTVLTFRCLMKG